MEVGLTSDFVETHLVTLDLAEGETYPLLVNALSAYADVLHRQSQEQAAHGQHEYSLALRSTAEEAMGLVRRITDAAGNQEAH